MIISIDELENNIDDIKFLYGVNYDEINFSWVNFGKYYFLYYNNMYILVRILGNDPIEINFTFSGNISDDAMLGKYIQFPKCETEYEYNIKYYEKFIINYPKLNSFLNKNSLVFYDRNNEDDIFNIKNIVKNKYNVLKRRDKIKNILE